MVQSPDLNLIENLWQERRFTNSFYPVWQGGSNSAKKSKQKYQDPDVQRW